MPGEGREPRTPDGQGLLVLIEGFKSRGALTEAATDALLDCVDETLAAARDEERSLMAFNLGLVAGEGYKQLHELQEWIRALLDNWSANTKGGLFDELAEILAASKKPTAPISSPLDGSRTGHVSGS